MSRGRNVYRNSSAGSEGSHIDLLGSLGCCCCRRLLKNGLRSAHRRGVDGVSGDWHQNDRNTGHYGDDTRPPMKPASFRETSPGTICWSAPGNDWNVGTAASYELRAFSAAPTPENFSSGTPLGGMPAPAAAGTPQCATVSTTATFVGLRALDAAGNISYPAKARVPRH